MLRYALAFTVALALPAGAETASVHVGDGTIDGSFLQPYDNAWLYSVKLPDGSTHLQGIWSDHVQWTTVDGKKALLRVQGTSFVTGASNVMLNTFDPKTMAPIVSETHGIDGTIFRRTFHGAHVTAVSLAGKSDTAAPVPADLPEAVYDFNGGLYGLLLACLPLKTGLAGSLPAVADRESTFSVEPFHVLRQETVSAGSRGRRKAWVVQSVKPQKYAMTFWLAKTPPYIIRLVMDDWANKRTLTWTMI